MAENTFIGARNGGNVTVEKIDFASTLKKILVLPIIRIGLRILAVAIGIAMILLVGRGAGWLLLIGSAAVGLRATVRQGTLEVRVNRDRAATARMIAAAGVVLIILAALDWWPVPWAWGLGAEPTCVIAGDVSDCAEWLSVLRVAIPGAWSNRIRFGEHEFGPWLIWLRLVLVIALPWAARLPFMDTEWIARMEQLFSKVPEASVGPLDPSGFQSPEGIEMRPVVRGGGQAQQPRDVPDYGDVPIVIHAAKD